MSYENTKKEKVPDVPQTALAFRVWRLGPGGVLLSLNAPAQKSSWIARALASPEGGWRPGEALHAQCSRQGAGDSDDDDDDDEDGKGKDKHGAIPGKNCTCGIYATTSLGVINGYLSPAAPVLGVVELGGRVIPATQGFRAEYARVAAILLADPVLTLERPLLEKIAETYQVPALVPHSVRPEDYRDHLRRDSVTDEEVEKFFRDQGTEG